MAKPKLALIPSGYSNGKLFSVLPSNGDGDFTFSRGSSATRVNRDGLIETMPLELGSDVLSDFDFTNWSSVGGTSSVSSDEFTTASTGGIRKTGFLTVGKSYKVIVSGTTTSTNTRINNYSGSNTYKSWASTGSFSFEFIFTASDGGMYLRHGGVGTTQITSFFVKEITSGYDLPRLNYDLLNGKVVNCPHYLLEPARTNLVTYSEDFSNAAWTKSNTTVNVDVSTSPNGGLNADKLIPNNSTDLSSISNYALFYLSKAGSAIEYTYSVFAKENGLNEILIIAQGNSVSNNASATFSLADGIIKIAALSAGSFSGASASVDNYGNGFYRLNLTFTTNTDTNLNIRNIPTDSTITTGNGVNGVTIWGAQLEVSSYPTSYIPTNGTAITRAAETATDSGNAATFNDSEGVLMAEISSLADDGTNRRIAITDANLTSFVYIYFSSTSTLSVRLQSGGSIQFLHNHAIDTTQNNKVAFKWKLNDVSMYVNGIKISSTNIANTPNGLKSLNFLPYGFDNFYGNTRELQYFDSALTDAQLETLTSWTSLQEMITSQLYTNY